VQFDKGSPKKGCASEHKIPWPQAPTFNSYCGAMLPITFYHGMSSSNKICQNFLYVSEISRAVVKYKNGLRKHGNMEPRSDDGTYHGVRGGLWCDSIDKKIYKQDIIEANTHPFLGDPI
jgi:hypothetical protein